MDCPRGGGTECAAAQAVNIKQLLIEKVYRDTYHAKQVYREIFILKHVGYGGNEGRLEAPCLATDEPLQPHQAH